MRSRDVNNDGKGQTTSSSDESSSPKISTKSMKRIKALRILNLDPSASVDDGQMKLNQTIEELSENQSELVAEQVIAMARAIPDLSVLDPTLVEFSEKYAYFSRILTENLTSYPQFTSKINDFSDRFYKLCSQFLLAIQKSDTDKNALSSQLTRDIETLILSINAEFRNATDSVNEAYGNVAAVHDYSKRDKDWKDMMSIVTPEIFEIVAYVLPKDPNAEEQDPLTVFLNAYKTFIEKMDVEVGIPEHQRIIKDLMQHVTDIGNAYFSKMGEDSADVVTLSTVYQEDLKKVLADIKSAFQKAGAEQAEIWPQLNPILKILATIVFVVRWSILAADDNISKRNRHFNLEKQAFETAITEWLNHIPTLDQDKYAEYNDRWCRKNRNM